MPTKALRACSGRCGRLVKEGKCPDCARQHERMRGSASSRGYDSRNWRPFRRRFVQMLIEAGIQPICGAALPDGPQTQDSQCQAEGRQTWDDLHFDHEPPLTESERKIASIVCDPLRIQLLCGFPCHARKTEREKRRGAA